ncbi:MAG TPA: hypothetical protein VH593_32255 [Ktedonobacteraceae bacterium]
MDIYFYTLELDPPTYQLVIEHHPTAGSGNNFRVKIVGGAH